MFYKYPVTLGPVTIFLVSFQFYILVLGARSSVVVKALCYKPEGRGFETR
jgi:hypothetical protein